MTRMFVAPKVTYNKHVSNIANIRPYFQIEVVYYAVQGDLSFLVCVTGLTTQNDISKCLRKHKALNFLFCTGGLIKIF